MKNLLALLALSLSVSVAVGGDDAKLMEGTWAATVLEAAGKPADEKTKALKFKIVVKGESYTTFLNDKQLSAGTLKLDPTKSPKTIDAQAKDGPYKDKVQPGIYELRGDEMRIVFAVPDMRRPTEFKTQEGTMETMLGYKRIKEPKK